MYMERWVSDVVAVFRLWVVSEIGITDGHIFYAKPEILTLGEGVKRIE